MASIIVLLFLFVLIGCETTDNNDTIDNVRLTFVVNGGTPIDPIEQEAGSDVTEPVAPTKEGYVFDGWYTDASFNSRFTFNTMPISNIVLYAKWNEVSEEDVVLIFDSNGGSFVSSISAEPNASIIEPNAPTRDGYTFDGWYVDNNFSTEFTFNVMPSEDTTIYAKWTENEESMTTITFNSNGGSSVASITKEVGTNVVEPTDPTRDGYTFEGWYEDTEFTTPFTFNNMPAEDITLYAKWEANQAITSTITFNSNGGSSVTSITQEPGTTILAPSDPTRDGYIFDGWYLDESFSTPFTFDIMPETDITLYAKWDEEVVTSTIRFNTNGGSSISPITAEVGTSISAPVPPTKNGYIFIGWYNNSSLTTAFTFNTMPSSDITLYAKWEQDQTVQDDLVVLLESDGWDFECTGYVCTEGNHFFDLDALVFTYHFVDNDMSDDQTFEVIITMDENWNVLYTHEKYYTYGGTTTIQISGNKTAVDNYQVDSFSSTDNWESQEIVFEDAMELIYVDHGYWESGLVAYVQTILDNAGITMDDLK